MGAHAIDTSGHRGHFDVTTDASRVHEAVGDLMLDLAAHAPEAFWASEHLSEDGREVRLTNAAGDTAYSFHLKAFSRSAQTGIVRFTAGGLSATADTTYRIYIMPGESMPAPSDTLGRDNVWEAGTLGVWLMDTDPSAGSIADATGRGHDAAPAGAMTGGDLVDGPIGRAIDFDGVDDRLDCTRIAALEGIDRCTLRAVAWQNAAQSGQPFIACKGLADTADNDGRLAVFKTSGDENDLDFAVENLTSNNGRTRTTSSAWTKDAWHLIYLAFDGSLAAASRLVGYIDGGQPAQSPVSNPPATTAATDGPLFIGCMQGVANFWAGRIAELRADTVTRSLDHHRTWHELWFNHAAFWTAGAWTPHESAEPPPAGSAAAPHAGEPARWLVVYNLDLPESLQWAHAYRDARLIPDANLLGLSAPADEVITEPAFLDIRQQIADHLAAIDDEAAILGVVLGFGFPGAYTRSDGHIEAIASQLQRLDASDAPVANPLASTGAHAITRPTADTLAGDLLTARIDAPTLADALALIDRAEALIAASLGDGAEIWLDPHAPSGSAYTLRRQQMLDWAASLDRQMLRVPIEMPDAGGGGSDAQFASIAGDAFFFGWDQPTPPAGFFADPPGRRVLAAQLRFDSATAPTLRDADDDSWAARAFAAGYAACLGSTRAVSASAVPLVAPLFEALRRGWTLGEAAHLALPLLRGGITLLGDPLLTVAFPRHGWDLFGPFDSLDIARFDQPIAHLRDEERSAVIDTAHRPAEGAIGVYVLRHLDARGRSEAGVVHRRVRRVGDALLRVPAAACWPDATGWRPTRAGESWRIVARWGAAARRIDLARAELLAQVGDDEPATVASADIAPGEFAAVLDHAPLDDSSIRYRVRAVSPDGGWLDGPWSASVALDAAPARTPILL